MQERALWLETELSTAQDRLGAMEQKAAQDKKRHSALQRWMDDWDAFDPDLHDALHASMLPPPFPNAGQQTQPIGTGQPTSSEAIVQLAHQVHTQVATSGQFVLQLGTT